MNMMVENDAPAEIMSAIEQLWNWVGEQQDRVERSKNMLSDDETIKMCNALMNAYSNVRLYMRKFFSGLIDFDSEERNKDERLSSDV